jgi:hypothetical protein
MVRQRTLGETKEEADALEDIARLIVKYFPPDSGINCKDVVTEVVRILERKSGPIFERLYPSAEQRSSALKRIEAYEKVA